MKSKNNTFNYNNLRGFLLFIIYDSIFCMFFFFCFVCICCQMCVFVRVSLFPENRFLFLFTSQSVSHYYLYLTHSIRQMFIYLFAFCKLTRSFPLSLFLDLCTCNEKIFLILYTYLISWY